ncbi:non-structural maintenance of chromosomes element 4 homolog A-like [Humulus lupulus]|uniref:non-structural maintenance of chromosomes element 4 homolog A-like n=1 Tax=Humulus lupulus TaxID=3486 RepID=UPI002B40F071|nr:non-structural maintenance of chromosomes element 4 homolog A-like [Humulus lupulus]
MARPQLKRLKVETLPTSEQSRELCSKYLVVVKKIQAKKDELVRPESEKFDVIVDEVETLFREVQKPREQVADGEALLGLANALATSAKSHSIGGVTPSDFITFLFRHFRKSSSELDWNGVGLAVSPIFMKAFGSTTMIGPMSNQAMKNCFLKIPTMDEIRKKPRSNRKRTKPTEIARPEKCFNSYITSVHVKQFDDARAEEKSDTYDDITTMFNILKKKPAGAVMESLVLNRSSFGQTVENLLALSFLVRDGRVEITVDENGCKLVRPRNCPGAGSIASRDVTYHSFVFRLDFKDWELMRDFVPVGEELMPHRGLSAPMAASPIKNLSRNRVVVAKQSPTVAEVCSNKDCNTAMQLQSLVTVIGPN